jgi:hypothetical protein
LGGIITLLPSVFYSFLTPQTLDYLFDNQQKGFYTEGYLINAGRLRAVHQIQAPH